MKTKLFKISSGLIILCLIVAALSFLPKAFAGTLTNSSVLEMGSTFSGCTSGLCPMIASDAQALAIDFTTVNTVSTSANVQVTFPAGFSVSATQGTPSASAGGTACNGSSGLFPAATPIPGTLAASGSGQIITITTTGTLSASTNYCIELPSSSSSTSIVNPATGSYNVTIGTYTSSTLVDSQTVSIPVLTAGQNIYTVTATIAPTFTMTLGTNSATFGTLSSSSINLSSSVVTTVATNAKSGWFLWAGDLNAGLKSTIAGYTIPSVTSSPYNFSTNAGLANEYGLGATTSGTAAGLSVPTGYQYTSATKGGQLSSSAYNEIAAGTGPSSGSTGSLTAQVTTNELVDILPTAPPATDYADTITLIGAGSF